MSHVSQGPDDLYRQARNVAVAVSFGKQTGESCYAPNPYATHREFVNALVSHIHYLERIGDPNRLITPDVERFKKLCRENPAKPFNGTEEKAMKKQVECENPEIVAGIDVDEVKRIANWTGFISKKPDVEIQENRLQYLRELLEFIETMPDKDHEVGQFYDRGMAAIAARSRK